MIRLRGLTFTYPGASRPAIDLLDLDVEEGEFLLVAGPSGAGKSTLLRTLNGLVPHYSGGVLRGTVAVSGTDVTGARPRDLAGLLGFVPQDPDAHAVADRVLPELAFAAENLGVEATRLRKLVEEAIDQLGLGGLRNRRLHSLSGGERQRVAIAAVLVAQPRVLVCDEPTSNLDPQSAEEVLSALVRLRDDLGLTIVCSEHRLERVAGFADKVLYLPRAGTPVHGEPREVFARVPFAPPVSLIGRKLGWHPLPLTVREARPFARASHLHAPEPPGPRARGKPRVEARGLRVSHNGTRVLNGVAIDIHAGDLVALMGRNGSGKTTLLRTIVGLSRPQAGTVRVDGRAVTRVRDAVPAVSYLPQRADAMLSRETVRAELHDTPQGGSWTERFGLQHLLERHPWDLSAGERLAVALAATVARGAGGVLLLDEPTRGLDAPGKQRLARILRDRADRGDAVLLVTHDVELVARAADRVAMLAGGEIVADGPVRDVLGASVLFTSQSAKVMDDPRFLTPDDVLLAAES